MIPTIETIVYDLECGKITAEEAIKLLNQHAALHDETGDDYLRDMFASAAFQAGANAALSWGPADFDKDIDTEKLAAWAYKSADAMLAQRSK